jgi:hypothetical protein
MIVWNERADIPQNWTFDAHLLDGGWREPRCSQACPTKALTTIKTNDEDLERLIEVERLTVLHPEFNTAPRVFYRHLQDAMSNMVCGNIAATDPNGQAQNLAGAEVTLIDSNEEAPLTAVTDEFGDFRFDRLRAWDAEIRLDVRHNGIQRTLVEQRRAGSANLGTLRLDR